MIYRVIENNFKANVTMNNYDITIEELRQLINKLDDTIIANIARRHAISQKIGIYKEQHDLAVYNKQREDELHAYHISLSKKYNVAQNLVIDLFDLIIKQSRTLQQKG